ncbi:glycosyltransferase family 39 protein [Paenibacillus chitinolyticus]|uniref:glycosyltransferase family 39 protein n=1 Tax=Paenibacillus chitinolyticus TaxID=79263 RepID=UPI00386D692E
MQNKRNNWIYIILGVALIIRTYYIFSISFPPLAGDALFYDKMAKQFLETGVLGYNQTEPNAFVTPGFPILLSLTYLIFGSKMIAFQLVQVIFSVITIWVIYQISLKFLGLNSSLFVAVLMTIYPSFIYANGLLLTEVSFTLFFSLFLLTLFEGIENNRKFIFILSGLFLGVSVLIRPTPATLVLPIIIYYFFHLKSKKNYVRALTYIGFFSFILVLPWWIRNYFLFDKVVLFSTSGSNPLLWGMHPYFVGVIETFEAIYKTNPDEITRNNMWAEKSKEMFFAQINQPEFVKWFVIGKLNYFWRLPWVENGEIAHLFEWLRKPLHLLLVIGGWIGICISITRKHPIQILSIIIIVYTFLHQIMLAIPRYAFPIMPYIIILFAFVLSVVVETFRKRSVK